MEVRKPSTASHANSWTKAALLKLGIPKLGRQFLHGLRSKLRDKTERSRRKRQRVTRQRTGHLRACTEDMKIQKMEAIATGIFLLLSAAAVPGRAQSTPTQVKPDNTKVNARDKNPDEATADQQKMKAADRALTAKIRKAVMADKALSTYAHNVKIISQDGTVTLKGPVRSDDEVNSIMAKATEVVGSADKVINQMSVKP
jgi:hyperosmotically inducible protein